MKPYVFVGQNYWRFGLCPYSGILKNKKRDVSETVPVSILKWRGIYTVGHLKKG
jgi:hypothetical protein